MDNQIKEVMEELSSLGITILIIAHRLSTIADCDKVIVMADGTVKVFPAKKVSLCPTYLSSHFQAIDAPYALMSQQRDESFPCQ